MSVPQPARHQALRSFGIQVGQEYGKRFPDDPAPVRGHPVLAQRQPGALKLKELGLR